MEPVSDITKLWKKGEIALYCPSCGHEIKALGFPYPHYFEPNNTLVCSTKCFDKFKVRCSASLSKQLELSSDLESVR